MPFILFSCQNNDLYSLGVHQHLTLSLSSGSEKKLGEGNGPEQLWVLLTRHLVDKERSGEFIHVYASEVEPYEMNRRSNPGNTTDLALKATYTSSTHMLVREVPEVLKSS